MTDRFMLDSKIEKFVTFSFFVFIFAGAIFLLAPKTWWPSFYSPTFFGVTSLISAVFIVLPKYILKPKDECNKESVMFLRLIISIAIILNGLGELYLYQLYKYGFQYDKVIHLITPFLFVIVLTSFGEVWFGASFKKSLKIAALIVFAGGILWEVFEFLSDVLFKTAEFGIYGQYKFVDTALDLLFDILGIFSGIVFLNQKRFYRKIVSEYCQGKI